MATKIDGFGPFTHLIAAELINDGGEEIESFAESQARHPKIFGQPWDEETFREKVRAYIADHLVAEGAEDEGTYTLVWNPGRDSAEEETI